MASPRLLAIEEWLTLDQWQIIQQGIFPTADPLKPMTLTTAERMWLSNTRSAFTKKIKIAKERDPDYVLPNETERMVQWQAEYQKLWAELRLATREKTEATTSSPTSQDSRSASSSSASRSIPCGWSTRAWSSSTTRSGCWGNS